MDREAPPTTTATYSNIEGPPSLKPVKRYCDVTGLEGKYVDPKSKLYYHSPEVFAFIRQQNNAIIQGYLGLRQASTMLI